MKITTIFLFSLFLCGCTSLSKQVANINPGDTRQRVLEVMGPPGDKQFNGQAEAWQYGAQRFGYSDYRIIWFHGGVVTGMSSYKNTQMGTTTGSGYQQIVWEQAPNVIGELRIR